MAKCKGKKVVAINYKGDFLCCCDSIREFCQINGIPEKTVYSATRLGKPFHKMKLIDEEVYRTHWMEGTTSQLGFKTRKQTYIDRARKIKENMSDATREARNRKIQVSQKQRVKDGKNHLVNNKLNCRKVHCLQTGINYCSLKEAAKSIGVSRSDISQSIRFGYKAKGLNFKYL